MNPRRLYGLVGALVKRRRKNLGLTQQKLASRLGISRASLANIETGRQAVLLHHLYEAANALQMDVTALLPSLAEVQAREDGGDLPMPENLKPEQWAQIARILRGDGAEHTPPRDEKHGRRAKDQS